MTPIRALFFLAAITAACAGRIPVQVETTHSLSTQIALLSHGNLGSNPIENAIEKLMELVRMLKEKVHQLENVLLDALQASSVAVAKKINDLIYEKTGIDLNLEKKLEAFEKKAETCNAAFKTDLKQVIGEIKTKAQTCAATEIAAVMDIRTRVVTLIELLEVVPAQTIEKIKACVAPTTMAPPTEAPTTMAPPTEAPTTMAPPTEAPTTMAPPTEAPANLGSWSDIWKEAKCVTQELAAAAEQLADVPAQVAKVVSDAAELHTKETIDKLEKCAVQSLAGMEDRVQLAAAQLAYCVIAPSKQQ